MYGNTALHLACYNGQDAVVNELTDYGANVNQPNNSGFTPLHFAAASTHGALCLELLVNNGADVNIQVGLSQSSSFSVKYLCIEPLSKSTCCQLQRVNYNCEHPDSHSLILSWHTVETYAAVVVPLPWCHGTDSSYVTLGA